MLVWRCHQLLLRVPELLAPSVTSVRSVANDKGDNEMIPGVTTIDIKIQCQAGIQGIKDLHINVIVFAHTLNISESSIAQFYSGLVLFRPSSIQAQFYSGSVLFRLSSIQAHFYSGSFLFRLSSIQVHFYSCSVLFRLSSIQAHFYSG